MSVFEGIKIIDLTQALSGPFTSTMLGDQGADIIKIEVPGIGDNSRAWGPPFVNGVSSYFISVNRNKKSVTLNLKDERGKEIFFKLVRDADVVLENFRPGVTTRLGIDYESVKKVNPKIVYASISGFGQDGPYMKRPGYDQVIQGMCGIMSITGEKGGEPVKVGLPVTDIASGMFAAFGVAGSLYRRQITGKGDHIDISMLDCMVSWLTFQAGRYFATGEVAEKMGSAHPLIVPYQAFKTKDIFINIAAGSDKLWQILCDVMEKPEWKDDKVMKTNDDRVKNRAIVVPMMGEVLMTRPGDEWLEKLTAAGVPCGPINTIDRVLTDEHVLFREMVQEFDHPIIGKFKQTGIPVKYKEDPGSLRIPPAVLGEHTREVLEELGYSAEEIDEFEKEKII
ncbi:MAG: CaiB/BaiF CoA transferase family protein [Candidatus Methanofastidiosia archaeon]